MISRRATGPLGLCPWAWTRPPFASDSALRLSPADHAPLDQLTCALVPLDPRAGCGTTRAVSSAGLCGCVLAAAPQAESSGDLVHAPGLGHKGEPARHIFLTDIAGGEHNPDVGTPPSHRLGELRAAHAGHAHINEQKADLRAGLKQGQSMVPVVGVEDRKAELLEDLNRRGAGHGIVLYHQHNRLGHQLNSTRAAKGLPPSPLIWPLSGSAGRCSLNQSCPMLKLAPFSHRVRIGLIRSGYGSPNKQA